MLLLFRQRESGRATETLAFTRETRGRPGYGIVNVKLATGILAVGMAPWTLGPVE